MDKQDEGLKLLKEIKHIDGLIQSLKEQIDGCYSMLTSTGVRIKEISVQSSGDPDQMAAKMGQVVDYQFQLQEYQKELCAKKTEALKIIRKMDIEKQQIIILKYFKCCTVEEIGEQIGYTYRWAWEKIHEAEEEFIKCYASQ